MKYLMTMDADTGEKYKVLDIVTKEFKDNAECKKYMHDLGIDLYAEKKKVIIAEAKTTLDDAVGYEFNFIFFKIQKMKYENTKFVITYMIVENYSILKKDSE